MEQAFLKYMKFTVAILGEAAAKDMQDMEFTKLRITNYSALQTRNGKRTATAAVKIAVDMADSGLIDKGNCYTSRIEPDQINQLLHPTLIVQRNNCNCQLLRLPASPGAACGEIAQCRRRCRGCCTR